ncbi:MAG: TylF/MycF/NovP-related O-methyltransferase [Candidatus Saccharibacteria bacterium]|nr:TylF/MycF/NovP-related O-methyltransferase [Candidatus Saccharibacteria bacterium]
MAFRNDQVSFEETEKILAVARGCLATEGDFVELGCYKGDTGLLLAEVLREERVPQAGASAVEKSVDKSGRRRLWLYDSFEGLPEKTGADFSELGVNFRAGELFVTKREVKERFLRAGLTVPMIKKAWFQDLGAEDLPEKIAFAFLDGDFYESIQDSLRLVEDKMVRGGTIIVHDYSNPALPGVRKAVDEWLACGKVCGKVEEYKSLAIISV